MTDKERLEFIKKRINYMFRKKIRQQDKSLFMDDLLWLIEKVDNEIKRKEGKPQWKTRLI